MIATIEMEKGGVIKIQLDEDYAPNTCLLYTSDAADE